MMRPLPLRFPRFIRGWFLLLLPWFAAAETPPFAHDASDVPVDPAVRYGQLSNGVRYALLPNREPRDRTALRLLVDAGSLHETEAQRGLAHFLEHMAFNGSTHYPPGTLIEFFQRVGMGFGNDTNAFTSFDRTVYMIDLPESTPDQLSEGLRVLRDYAGGLLLLPEEIERERGVILSEKRSRDSVEWRSFVAELDFLLGDTRLAHRLPIGLESTLAAATVDDFRDYYDTWYRPERLTLVAVGDFDAAEMERLLNTAFADLTARAPARAAPPPDEVATVEGVRVLHHVEPEAGNVTVGIQTLLPYRPEPDTAARRVQDLPRDLAFAMLSRRLTELAKQEGAPFSGGYASAGNPYDIARNATIELRSQTDTWREALKVTENELRRALEFGFREPELREVAAGLRNQLEQGVKRAPTRRSPQLAMSILSAIADERVFTTPETDLALIGPALDEVTVEACAAAFRAAWEAPHRFVTVVGNTGEPATPEATATIAGLFASAAAITLEAPPEIEDVAFAYTDFGPPGTIYSRTHVGDLDVVQVEFANRVRLNIKKTDFSAQSIGMSIRVGGGQLTEPVDREGLGVFAENTFILGGLGAHSSDDLRRILAGRNVGVGFNVGADAFVLSGGTTPDDLLLQLQLATAYLVDPGYRPEAARQMRKAIAQYYTRLAHIPQGPLQTEVPRLLASGDTRFGMPAQAVLDLRTSAEVREWLTPELRHGALEIGLVGDLDIEAAIDAVARTFGALPPRAAKPAFNDRRQVSFPAPFARDYRVPTEIPKGIVSIYWPTTDGKDVHTDRRLRVLANVLADRLRLKIREELGSAYSPGAGSNASDTYDGYGSINAYIEVDPAQAAALAAVTRQLAAELARDGATDDEVMRAVQPVLTGLRESARTNGYWLGAVLASAQEFPQRLDWARDRYADNESITAGEISALAARYLGDDRAFQVIVLPE